MSSGNLRPKLRTRRPRDVRTRVTNRQPAVEEIASTTTLSVQDGCCLEIRYCIITECVVMCVGMFVTVKLHLKGSPVISECFVMCGWVYVCYCQMTPRGVPCYH